MFLTKVLYSLNFCDVGCCKISSINNSDCLITLTLYPPLCSSGSLLSPDALATVLCRMDIPCRALQVLDIIAEADRRPEKV